MTILVIGGSGFIGDRVLSALILQHLPCVGTFFTNPRVKIPGCRYVPMDVRQATSVYQAFDSLQPSLVIQVCCTKDIGFCAQHFDEAREAHVIGTSNVVNACKKWDSRHVFISTDCVFEGTNDVFSEEDSTAPFNHYGLLKREGEILTLDSGLNSLVIRASLLFGWTKNGQSDNFVLRVLRSMEQGKTFQAATNLVNTPLEIGPAAQTIVELALSGQNGVYHVAGNERISRYQFAVRVAWIFGFDTSLIIPFEDNSGLRQNNSCLSVDKIRLHFGIEFENAEAGLLRMRAERGG